MTDKYILKDGIPKPVDDLMEWANWFEIADRVVDKTKVGEAEVSTVFLGLDHSFGGSVPILYETMIFGGEHDQYQERYTTLEEAKEGHQKAILLIEEGK